DARVPLVPVPEAPVAAHRADWLRHCVRRSFDFLEAEDVGLLALDPLQHFAGAGADAVHVPGGDLQHGTLHETKGATRGEWAAPFAVPQLAPRGMTWTLLLLLEFSVDHVVLLRLRPGRCSCLRTGLGSSRAAG